MGEQRTFAGIAWSQKGKVTRREQFLAEMDAVIPWAAAARADRALLPEGRAGAAAAGAREDAADLLPAAVVQSLRPAGGGRDLRQRGDAAVRPRRARGRRGARRDDDPALPPPARAAPADRGDLRGGQGAAHREAAAAAERDDRRRDDHRRAQLDEECGPGARSRDEADAEGERVAFRDEAARRDGPEGARPQPDRDACGRRRHHPAARAAARRGGRALRRPGVLEGSGSAGLRSPGRAVSGESARRRAPTGR